MDKTLTYLQINITNKGPGAVPLFIYLKKKVVSPGIISHLTLNS